MKRRTATHVRTAFRIVASHYVANGIACALGLLAISTLVELVLGAFASSVASVGVIVCIPPDQPAPKRRKLQQLLPAALIGPPLFYGIQALQADPLHVALLLVPASFFAFLAGAWGRRGIPIAVSIMFAMIFSMAVPEPTGHETPLSTTLYFALGAVLYLVWGTLANALLNRRFRVQMLADTLLALARLMRTQALQFAPPRSDKDERVPLIGTLLQQQAALADQAQLARNILLESPRTTRRQQLAGMFIQGLELRDHLVACELDLDALRSRPGHAPALSDLREVLTALAKETEDLADALLLGRKPRPFTSLKPRLAALPWDEADTPSAGDRGPSPTHLAHGLANRVGYVDDEVGRLYAIARGECAPNLDVVRAAWRMFVSPTAWSWQPFLALWRWDAPPLRHAIRAALAIATGYAIALALPWSNHAYWILLTIVVVLRGSLAQTLERRNSRAAGTLIGCVVAGALLAAHPPLWLLMTTVTLAQAVAHAFAPQRYLVTAIAATILGLVQAHLLGVGSSPVFDIVERMGDTLIGVVLAWVFSYVLPSWERGQIRALVQRTLAAQARHAGVALNLGQLTAIDNEPELQWRLARREAYDSLSALVQATQRSLFEPRAVRPPLEPLGRMMAHSYQLLAQLTAVKTMLLLRRGSLKLDTLTDALVQTGSRLRSTLVGKASSLGAGEDRSDEVQDAGVLPDPLEGDLNPWLLRRLALATDIAERLRHDANDVLRASRA